jgi:hypothetical protein
MGSGQYIIPLQRIFLNLSGGTVTGDTLFTQNLSASTIFSGSTDLSDIFSSISTSINTGATRVQDGINTFTAGTQFFPTVNITGISIDNISVSGASMFNALTATTISGGTIYSGATNLSDVITSLVSASDTFVQDGTNTFTGGTSFNPTVNVTALTINNISASGTSLFNTLSANTVSGGTLFSGSTDLSLIFQTIGSDTDHTFVQPGSNITTGGTTSLPIVSAVDSPSFNDISFSGTGLGSSFSATTLSGGTIYSGSTDLNDIIIQLITGSDTFVQDGTNTFTGGTPFRPTINVTGLSVNNISVSGTSLFNSLSANTVSGGTYYSGSTSLENIISTIASGQEDITRVQPGTNTYTGGTPNLPTVNVSALTVNTITASGNSLFSALSATSLSGSTIYSGDTDVNSLFFPIYAGLETKFDKSGGTVTGDVFIIGNVEITGTATTINTQTIQAKDNNILLNFSGTHITAIGGGITLLSGQTSGEPSTITSDSSGNWNSNVEFYAPAFSGTSITATNFFSGASNLNSVFAAINHTHPISGITGLQNALDTKADLSGATFSGQINSPALSSTTISGGTYFSGSTPLELIISSIASGQEDITRVQVGTNTYTGGTDNFPTVNVSALTINNISVSGASTFNTITATTVSGGTIYSGSTDLSLIFQAIGADTPHTFVQPGSNITTGGTASVPIVSTVASPLFNDLTFSGTGLGNSFSATTLSGGTIYSGSTDLGDIITSLVSASDTFVQDGINTFTGGTPFNPTVNVTGLTIDNISVSGSSLFDTLSANTISGGTIFSGSTNLYSIFALAGSGSGDVTRVQPGTNTYTGGTANFPTVNVSALTISSISVSGSSVFSSLSATTLSGGTIFSGSTNLSDIFHQKNGYLLQKAGIASGSTFVGTPKSSVVTFTTAFSNNNYAVTVTGEPNRTWTIESKTASGFTINANAGAAFTENVFWIACRSGEGFV